jgi:hypothetical protein
MSARGWRRRLSLGLPTVLGLARRGYFIPYRYAGAVPPAAARAGFPWLEDRFHAAEPDFIALMTENAEAAATAVAAFDGAAPPHPRWQQSWYPRLDGLAAYLLIRSRRPARIVEIGSGHSTRFAAAAIADGGLETRIDAVDPAPRADLAGLASVTLHRTTAQAAPHALFEALGPGDMLMIDSSHIALPGSDVDLLLGRVIPALPSGVLVQIHDIFLPDAYPESWAWRGYAEQLPVATLLAGTRAKLLWSSHWIATRRPDLLQNPPLSAIPHEADAPESALWLEMG